MPIQQHFPSFSVEINREEIAVDTMIPTKVPDEKWRYVDMNGHGHFWQGDKLPTLEWVVTGTEWVGDEYGGEEYDVGEYRCLLCAEVVEPGRRVTYEPTSIPGPTQVTVTISDESFTVTTDEYAASLIAWREALRGIRD